MTVTSYASIRNAVQNNSTIRICAQCTCRYYNTPLERIEANFAYSHFPLVAELGDGVAIQSTITTVTVATIAAVML